MRGGEGEKVDRVGWVRPLFGRTPTPMAPGVLGYGAKSAPDPTSKKIKALVLGACRSERLHYQ